jgi:histone H3/H4
MSEILVVTSKVKALGKAQGLRTGAEAIEELSRVVERIYAAAAEKAKAAGRKTVLVEDIG